MRVTQTLAVPTRNSESDRTRHEAVWPGCTTKRITISGDSACADAEVLGAARKTNRSLDPTIIFSVD